MKRAKRFCTLLLPVFVLAISEVAAEPIWTVHTVDTGLNSYSLKSIPNSVAWAPDGTLGVAYYDFNPTTWRYSSFDGSMWSAPEAIATLSAQQNNSYVSWQRWVELKYNSSSQPRVAYQNSGSTSDYSDDIVGFAYHNGSGWTNRTVPSQNSGGQIGLDLDANGDANISFYATGGLDAYFARGTAVSDYNFPSSNVDPIQTSGTVASYGSDIIRDGSGNLVATYFDNTGGRLYSETSTNNGATWTNRQEIFDGSRPAYPSLSVDENGNVGVSFVDVFTDSLYYSTFNGSTWSTEQVPVPDLSGSDLFTTDAATLAYYNDTPYIAFVDANRDLYLANKDELDQWNFQFVADTATYGLTNSAAYPFLSISDDGNAAISFYDYTSTTQGTIYVATASFADTASVPEPSSLAFIAVGSFGFYCMRKKRCRNSPNGSA